MGFDMAKLLGLRPRDGSVAALREAQLQAIAARDAAAARAVELEASRGDVLLDGRADAVARHETALAEARAEAERAGALVEAIGPRLAAAEAREQAEEVRRLRAEAREAAETAARFFRVEYAGLAAKIAAGLDLERAAAEKIARATVAESRAMAAGASLEDGGELVQPARQFWSAWSGSFGDLVVLPSLEGPPYPQSSAMPIWPRGRQ